MSGKGKSWTKYHGKYIANTWIKSKGQFYLMLFIGMCIDGSLQRQRNISISIPLHLKIKLGYKRMHTANIIGVTNTGKFIFVYLPNQ